LLPPFFPRVSLQGGVGGGGQGAAVFVGGEGVGEDAGVGG